MEHTYENALEWRRKQARRTWRPCWHEETEEQRDCYRVIWKGLLAHGTSISLPCTDPAIAEKALKDCLQDEPLLFDVGSVQLSLSPSSMSLHPQYTLTEEDFTDAVFAVRDALQSFRKTRKGKPTADIIKDLHDWIVNTITYTRTEEAAIHEAWHVFQHHAGVCDGIAKAAKILLDDSRIPSRILHGTSSQNDEAPSGHAWNLILEEDKWYHYDFTFDTTLSEGSDAIHYDYCRLSEAQIRKDHDYDASSIKDLATDDADWFRTSDRYFTSKKKLRIYIRSCLAANQSAISFRLPFTSDPTHTRDTICTLVHEELSRALAPGSSYSVSFNEGQMVMTVYCR